MKRKKINLPLVLCAVLVAVLSCFAFVRVGDSSVVKADSVTTAYTFDGSSWLTLMVQDNSKFSVANNRISFTTIGDTSTIDFYCKNFNVNDEGIQVLSMYNMVATGYWIGSSYYGTSLVNGDHSSFSLTGTVDNYWLRLVRQNNAQERSLACRISRTAGFTGQVSTIHIYIEDYAGNSYSQFGQYWDDLVVVKYLDANNNYLAYAMPTFAEYASNFTDRIYYLSSDLSDNQIYNQGYQEGVRDNQENIYNEGYNAGQIVGFNNGYVEGSEDSNQYTFMNLISSVIDAPISYFRSLFNFNLLGVNLTDFFLGLFTLCVIVTIVKLTLGR